MKLAIVIPWFGRDLKGGAEQQAWQIALRLAARGHAVEVLTTCCRSHQDDWATNHLPAGISRERERFAVRRFPVDQRNRAAFDAVCAELLNLEKAALKPGVSPVSDETATIFTRELIKSKELVAFLTAHRNGYDWFLFLPYLYGPILEGIGAAGERAVLQPCLHDEAYAYLPQVAAAFYSARQLFFNSEGEQELAFRLFGPGIAQKSHIVGEGVESPPSATNAARLGNGSSPKPDHRYVLYLGRKDPGKNVPLLVRAFSQFRKVRPNSKLGLVLAGPGHTNVEEEALPHIVDAGLVTNEKKEELLRQCLAVVQPSQNESFSRVMMEAWLRGKPVGVNTRCPATALPLKRTGAGWLAESEEEWAQLFVDLDRTPESELRRLGEKGQLYAKVEADWEVVIDRYEAALRRPSSTSVPRDVNATRREGFAINQFLPNLSYGDAISNEAIWIRDELRKAGFQSDIQVQFIDPRVSDECRVFTPSDLERSDAVIYHHSIGTAITPHLIDFAGPNCLIYHNITPGEFFESYRPQFARILDRGRRDLAQLARHFPCSVGDSHFNAAELEAHGFCTPGVLPLAIDPDKWAFPPDQALMNQLQDGRTNILFVGRFAPNKKQDDLLVAFANYLTYDREARLILVGKPEMEDPYVEHLEQLVDANGLRDSILMPGSIQDAELAAYYRTAHLFWSMSEHEGFCVPLIEAMWFDVPIFAFKEAAVPETLGDAAFMFSSKEDPAQLAAAAHLIIHDVALREKLIAAQRRRRADFLPARVRPVLMRMVEQLTAKTPRTLS